MKQLTNTKIKMRKTNPNFDKGENKSEKKGGQISSKTEVHGHKVHLALYNIVTEESFDHRLNPCYDKSIDDKLIVILTVTKLLSRLHIEKKVQRTKKNRHHYKQI